MPRLRYVILHHTGVAEPHYDVMVETVPGGPLRTWRSAVWPIIKPTAVAVLADHRAAYLTYEGPVCNNRGHVKCVAAGECAVAREGDDWLVEFDNHQAVRFSPTTATPY
jgi:hypothetical protein